MAFSAGSDDFLTKPFSYTELISRVKALLRRYYVYKGKDSTEISDGEYLLSAYYDKTSFLQNKSEQVLLDFKSYVSK